MIEAFIYVYIFMLAGFVGYEVIGRVPVILHTPLMSGSNFVHGIVLVGAMVVLGQADTTLEKAIGFIGVFLGAGVAQDHAQARRQRQRALLAVQDAREHEAGVLVRDLDLLPLVEPIGDGAVQLDDHRARHQRRTAGPDCESRRCAAAPERSR